MSWRRPRHEHLWEVTSQRFTPPCDTEGVRARGPDAARIVKDLIYGYTVTGMRCTSCGEIKSRRDLGDIRPQGG